MTTSPGNDQRQILDDLWMIRPCGIYLDELKECSGFKSRFHQRYTIGHDKDCSQWKKDYEACNSYSVSKSASDAEILVASERQRRKERIASVKNNDVWQYRSSPPPDWNSPLPQHLLRNVVPEVTGNAPSLNSCVIS